MSKLSFTEFQEGVTYLYESCRWLKLPCQSTQDRWYEILQGIYPEIYKKALESILKANKINFLEVPVQYQILDGAEKIRLEVWKAMQAQAQEGEQKLLGTQSQKTMDNEERAAGLKILADYRKKAGRGGKPTPKTAEEREKDRELLRGRFKTV